MPSNNSKYTQEMRDQTAEYMRSGKSTTSVANKLGISALSRNIFYSVEIFITGNDCTAHRVP